LLYATPFSSAHAKVIVPLSGLYSHDPSSLAVQQEDTRWHAEVHQHTTHAHIIPGRIRAWLSRQPNRALAILAPILLLALSLTYYYWSNETAHTQEAVAGAQQAISLAITEINRLPQNHSLREQLYQFYEWQKELERYAPSTKLPPTTLTRVRM